jgi:hypothetical protein
MSFDSSLELEGIHVHGFTFARGSSDVSDISNANAGGAMSLTSYLPSTLDINNTVEKFLYPSVTALSSPLTPLTQFTSSLPQLPQSVKNLNLESHLNSAMERIISPKQQKRASRVWEGVWGAISSAGVGPFDAENASIDEQRKEQGGVEPELITFSPSTWLTHSPLEAGSVAPPLASASTKSASTPSSASTSRNLVRRSLSRSSSKERNRQSILEEMDDEDTITSRVLSPTRASVPCKSPVQVKHVKKGKATEEDEEDGEWSEFKKVDDASAASACVADGEWNW